MKWLDLLSRLWTTPRKEVVEQKSVEESATGQKEVDSAHKSLKKKPRAKPTTKPTTKPTAKPTHTSTKIQAWDTQLDGIPENARQTQAIIGLDFGTAFTKVVISVEGQKYGVPLNDVPLNDVPLNDVPLNDSEQGTNKYLLPTLLYKDFAGNYSIDKPKKYESLHTDLKMRILDNNLDDDTRSRIIAYIAQVLQKSRYWLMTEKRSVIGGARLKWAVNVGLPTERYTQEDLGKTYRDLVGKAWAMSAEPPPEAERDGKQNNTERTLHPELIEAFPEFVAQIQGYISSSQRKPGIHTLIDVGAGTIDATVFIVHEEYGENRHPILSESVERLGTTYLFKHRCEKRRSKNDGAEEWELSPQDLFPMLNEFIEKFGVSEEMVNEADNVFRGKVINDQIYPLLKKAQSHGGSYGNEIVNDTSVNRMEREKERTPLMLCGGGAQVEFYEEVVNRLMKKGCGYLLGRDSFPALDELNASLNAPGILKKDCNRLSVAYGLSFEAADIGKISRWDSSESEMVSTDCRRKCPLPSCNGFLKKDGNCAKCGHSGFL